MRHGYAETGTTLTRFGNRACSHPKSMGLAVTISSIHDDHDCLELVRHPGPDGGPID